MNAVRIRSCCVHQAAKSDHGYGHCHDASRTAHLEVDLADSEGLVRMRADHNGLQDCFVCPAVHWVWANAMKPGRCAPDFSMDDHLFCGGRRRWCPSLHVDEQHRV